MQNNGKWKIARSDRKSKKKIMVSSKSHTECEQDWSNYIPVIHSLQIELYIVGEMYVCS